MLQRLKTIEYQESPSRKRISAKRAPLSKAGFGLFTTATSRRTQCGIHEAIRRSAATGPSLTVERPIEIVPRRSCVKRAGLQLAYQ